jgi:hypothetical protein
MDFKEVVWEGLDWIHVAQNKAQWGGGAAVNMVMNLRVP